MFPHTIYFSSNPKHLFFFVFNDKTKIAEEYSIGILLQDCRDTLLDSLLDLPGLLLEVVEGDVEGNYSTGLLLSQEVLWGYWVVPGRPE